MPGHIGPFFFTLFYAWQIWVLHRKAKLAQGPNEKSIRNHILDNFSYDIFPLAVKKSSPPIIEPISRCGGDNKWFKRKAQLNQGPNKKSIRNHVLVKFSDDIFPWRSNNHHPIIGPISRCGGISLIVISA